MTAKEAVILALKQGNTATQDIKQAVGYKPSTTAVTLSRLVKEGEVQRVGYGQYRLPQERSWFEKVKQAFA